MRNELGILFSTSLSAFQEMNYCEMDGKNIASALMVLRFRNSLEFNLEKDSAPTLCILSHTGSNTVIKK